MKISGAVGLWAQAETGGPRGASVHAGILVPQPGIEPVTPVVEAQSLNHWTAREVQDKF